MKRNILHYFRGWVPQEPARIHKQKNIHGKSGVAAAYVVGFGVGIGVLESLLLTIYAFGWDAIESSLSPPLSLLLGIVVGVPLTLIGLAVGMKLSKKLKERWVS